MRFFRGKIKEAGELRSIILIAFILTAFTLSIHLVDVVRDYFAPYTRLEFSEILVYGLIFWVLVTLWVAYRRWRNAWITDHELEDVLAGLNPDAFLVVSPERRILMCNEQVRTMFGYQPDELVGKTTDLLYFDRRSPNADGKEIYHRLERFGFHLGFATGKRRNGETFPLEIITGNLRARRGAAMVVRDITKLVKAEEAHREKAELLAQLEENFAKLKLTEEARDTLLQMIVHDMKTPLQVIMGNMELMKLEVLDGVQNLDDDQMEETLGHVKQLVQMVNSLLDVGRLESGDLPLHLSKHDLRVAAREAVSGLRVLAQGRSLQLELPEENVPVRCDQEVIQRVFTNLLTNAIKYTPDNTLIHVHVSRRDQAAHVDIVDTGPGIPERHRARIFEKFAQGDHKDRHRGYASTGIGLTFCKLAVEAHQGRIGVHSEVGRGSTFWFELPLHEKQRATVAASPSVGTG